MKFQTESGRVYAMDGEKLLAEVTFPDRDGVADITHTFVDDSLRGQGVASQLLDVATAQIRADGHSARPLCSYAQSWFANHPEATDLLKEPHRPA